ncbi:MAG: DUF4388 domain-containing protein [Planctomycetes bacterium]|nr:DUF4388 domain-containing protein [Planctomycetota bacterium]
MALRGDLASVDLAQVFQMLALNKKAGLLSIQGSRLWKVLYFDQRGVTVHHNVHGMLDRVLASLLRMRRLDQASVDEVRDHAARTGQPLTDSLLAGGYLQPAELEEQYRLELEEEIYDLFFCKEAKFEFYEGTDHLDGHDGAVDERFFFNCDSVIMEAARRIDEWAYISERVPTTAELLAPVVDALDAEQYGADAAPVFELLDGRRNVARVVEVSGLSTFQVCKALSQMLDGGAIAPVAPEQLVGLADQCMAEGRLPDAINLYERAIGLGVGLPEAHSLAAAAYHAAEEYEHAVYHLECEAEARIAGGDRAGAACKLHEAQRLVPTDLQARERLVELTVGEGAVVLPDFDPMAAGKELVELLLEFGDVQRVRSLLERLLLVAPGDPDLKKALVNVHVKAGDQKRVVELYESIADDLVRAHRPIEAIGYLQKILLMDRSRGDVSERVRQLYESDERARRRGRAMSALAVVFCVLLVLGAGYWFYDRRADADFARIDVHDLVGLEDFAGARAVYEEFVVSHPLATAVARAKAELQQIEAAQQRFEARRSAERAARTQEQQRLRSEYRVQWTKQRELFLAGQPEAAFTALTRVRELVGAVGGPDDMAWALEQQVERTWTRLRDHLDTAARLLQDHEAKLAAGDWRAARDLGVRLVGEFESTQAAARAQLPVLLASRPAGARILRDGQPLEQTVDGRTQPLCTPAVVTARPGDGPLVLDLELAGFAPRRVQIDARSRAEAVAVLEIVAQRRVAFDVAAQTGVGLGEGWLAVGLRGGRLGLARTDGSARRVVELGGLKAVDSVPVVQGGRVFFASNENTLECVALDRDAVAWRVPVPGGFATEPTAREGRIAVVDRSFVLHCWEQAGGAHLWSVSLDSAPTGPPTIDRRQVHVATVDGRVLTIDAADGAVQGVLRSPAGVTTRVLCDRGVLFFGCGDGNVRAVELAEGRVLWAASVGRALPDGDLALGPTVVVAIDGENALVALRRDSGESVGRLPLDGNPHRGVKVQGNRTLVQLRRTQGRGPASDVLLAVSTGTMVLQWEFADGGQAPGLVGADDLGIAWPSADGEVVLFR